MQDQAIKDLRALIGADQIITDQERLAPMLVDSRGTIQGAALAAICPVSSDQLSAAMQYCDQNHIQMVPQGGNTGRVGGATPDASGKAMLIHLGRMNRVLKLDPESETILVEAGCIVETIQKAAANANRLFPVSFGAQGSAQIGGALATNAGGIHVLRYGSMRDQVLGLEAILPDGRRYDGIKSLVKDNSGYDLKQLLIGSEGTLGIITAAQLRLRPPVNHRLTLILALSDLAAIMTIFGLLRSWAGASMLAFEVMSGACIKLVPKHLNQIKLPLGADHAWQLIIEFEQDAGEGERAINALSELLSPLMEAGTIEDIVIAQNVRHADEMWALRDGIVEAQYHQAKPVKGSALKHDIAVPVAAIYEFHIKAQAALLRVMPDLNICAFGHVGDGNWHYNLLKPDAMDIAEFENHAARLSDIVHDTALSLGGTISAEHGIGSVKRDALLHAKSPLELDLMRGIKQLFDPKGLMNPGKIL